MDPDLASEILQRSGMALLLYYVELPADDRGYRLDDDVDWVLDGLDELGPVDRGELRDRIGRTILDPTAHRELLFALLYAPPADPADDR